MAVDPVAVVGTVSDALPQISGVIADTTRVVVEADHSGWFGAFVELVENSIIGLHGILGPGSYGFAIILLTLILKGVTFPLNYVQIESTTKMQALSPAIKRIQAKYANDPQQMNMMMSQLYQENELNPLAGCLPAFAQIPIFIALYRSLINLANADKLEESFLWLPNLEGPTYGASNADWLLKFDNWQNGAPPLGWHDTAAYLFLPCLLIAAQSVSAELLKPPKVEGPAAETAEQTNAVLKYLPFLIGIFSLNVPSGLTLYWFVNNIVTTLSTVYIRGNVAAVTMGGEDVVSAEPAVKPKKFREPSSFDDMLSSRPSEAKKAPQSFSSSKQPVTIDAEVVEAAEDEDGELSKTAEKKQAKAAKTRRAKKTRK
jgi:YidC/Oxa1 family membrane protein insertase